jgi:hypothetical protein
MSNADTLKPPSVNFASFAVGQTWRTAGGELWCVTSVDPAGISSKSKVSFLIVDSHVKILVGRLCWFFPDDYKRGYLDSWEVV